MSGSTEMDERIESEGNKPDLVWWLACGLITAAASFLRFFDLGLKPFHHDEGVNGFFLTTLFRDGVYRYDPANYHGPTLYYISLVFSKLFGLNTLSVRASVAIFGVLTVILAFFLRNFIGKVGALAAAAFLAFSPGMVFISRYFIHEMFFIFLSLAFVLAILHFIRNKAAGPFAVGWMALLLLVCFLPSGILLGGYLGGDSSAAVWAFRAAFCVVVAILVFLVMRMLLAWRGGRPIYLLLASASAALLFATKETTFITLGTMIIAIPCVLVWQRIYGHRPAEFEDGDATITWSNFRAAVGDGLDLFVLVIATILVFLYVNALFFSSFFTYPDGIWKAFEAYAIWTQTGTKDHTQSGFWAYLKWSFGYGQAGSKLETAVEAAVIVLSAAGTAIAFFLGRNKVAMFIGLWAVGLFLAYSLIPYKTPWLALSFLLPMCLIAGYAINELANRTNAAVRYGGMAVGAAACLLLAYQSYGLNFVNYDNNDRTYVYAHTKREFLAMMSRIEHYASKSGKEKDTTLDVMSPDYWPMVWYTNNYPKTVYHGRMLDNSNAEVIVAKKNDQDREVIARYSSKYKLAGTYPLRPGVDLVLLVRNDLAEPGDQDLYRLRNP